MASPPHRPTTTYSSLSNPKKRPALNTITSQPPNSKRRKHPSISTASTPGASHPLRQTSFPPEEDRANGARSVSVESDATGVTGKQSIVTTGTGARKGRRGRKKKADGSVKSVKSVKSGVKEVEGSVQGGEEDEEDDGEGEGDEGLEDDGEKVDKVAEKKNLTVLVDAFNREQNDRYDMFRRVKLKKETVRKITNQTLSQSVPPSIITTINGFTKVFIGHLIERARSVQPPPTPAFPPIPDLEISSTSSTSSSSPDDNDIFAPARLDSVSFDPEPERRVVSDPVPLLPDDLREALRRRMRDGVGGGTGMGGVSVGLGVQGTAAARLGGRRLFG